VEVLVAALQPRPDVAPTIRKLPAQTNLSEASATPPDRADGSAITPPATPTRTFVSTPPPVPVVQPLAPERFKVQFTVSRETHDKLRHAQDLLRHSIPNGDPAKIFDRALTLLVQDLERRKLAHVARPRSSGASTSGNSRHIPAHVRREVSRRDGGRCAFVGKEGRCRETAFLEFHHVEPYATGGTAVVNNIQWRCRAHNQYEARLLFGDHHSVVREERACWPWFVAASIGRGEPGTVPAARRHFRGCAEA
jgi:hypothetical protein